MDRSEESNSSVTDVDAEEVITLTKSQLLHFVHCVADDFAESIKSMVQDVFFEHLKRHVKNGKGIIQVSYL